MGKATFIEIVQRLTKSSSEYICRSLFAVSKESSIMHQMVENLYNETQLRSKDWIVLVNALLKSRPDPVFMTSTIKSFCQDNRILRGRRAKINPTQVFGRIISFDSLSDLLVKLRYHADVDEAKASIRAIIGRPISKLPLHWKNRDMGRFLMWATFSPLGHRPFEDLPPDNRIILCLLGMNPNTYPILYLEYCLPNNIKARVPTFCDAYASNLWTRYFRPAPFMAPYGLTMPTEECPVQVGLPEVVHEVIMAENLIRPIRFSP
jgi:hypothetical protein